MPRTASRTKEKTTMTDERNKSNRDPKNPSDRDAESRFTSNASPERTPGGADRGRDSESRPDPRARAGASKSTGGSNDNQPGTARMRGSEKDRANQKGTDRATPASRERDDEISESKPGRDRSDR
jgi:hypothetical protein